MSRARYFTFVLTAACIYSQSSAPVFRAGTKLVEVTVTVLDKKGHAVTGLEARDFTVLDDGKSRQVAFFRFDGAPAAATATASATAPPPPKLPEGFVTNRAEAAGTPHTIAALVLDSINTPSQESIMARAQMMRYLRELAPHTRVGIFLMGKQIRIVHDFTDDAASLRARLAKVSIGMPVNEVTDYNRSIVEAEAFVDMFAGDPQIQQMMEEMMRQQLEVEGMANAQGRRYRMETSLAAMEALGKHLAGIPGRKNLIWIGGGFSMVSITGAMGMGPRGGVEDYESKVRETSRKLAQQGVILYIVDSKGITLPSDQSAASPRPLPVRGRGRFEPQMDGEAASNDPQPAMQLMANITGGRYLHNTNDLTVGFKQTSADIEGSYTLGFYLVNDPDDKWHKLKVKVNRSGIEVRHREGYIAESSASQPLQWSAEKWTAAFANPVASTVIPLTAKCERTANGEVLLSLIVDANAILVTPDGDKYKAELELGIADRASDGTVRTSRGQFAASIPAAQWETVKQQGLGYRKQWKPGDGATSVRIIVRDSRTGQYGSLDVKL
ncbi:MAG TPA: VWA domain-containing protein [Candidatus Solibacter sp.]|nr:VWA domain-containing protein [Candidatus Solibacter sp.]